MRRHREAADLLGDKPIQQLFHHIRFRLFGAETPGTLRNSIFLETEAFAETAATGTLVDPATGDQYRLSLLKIEAPHVG